ncbi:Semaphorin-2A, partial [Armadillidium vulgare]
FYIYNFANAKYIKCNINSLLFYNVNGIFFLFRNRVMKLHLDNITRSNCETDSLILSPSSVNNCVSRGKSEKFNCRNHIRVIQPVKDNRLYICGTNAHNPKDWIIYANLTKLPRHEHVPGIGNGMAKCPFDPEDNSTAIWVENGNPGDLPALYSGTVADFTKADTVIFRGNLYNFTTKRMEFPFKRTIKYDSKWLDKSVYKIPGDDSRFYAVFTTSMNGLMGSAICTFTLRDIQKAFMGRFKEQATSSSAWLPVLTSKVPEPRPGQCA